MTLDWSKMIPMGISAIAALVSVFFAYKSKKMQTQLIENKSDIEELGELIEHLKLASAIHNHPHDFSDNDFELGPNLKEIPAKIAKLIQNPKIGSQIKKNDWELPIDNFDNELPRAKAFRFGSNSLREERYLIALSSKILRRKRLGIKPVQIKPVQIKKFIFRSTVSSSTTILCSIFLYVIASFRINHLGIICSHFHSI